MLNNLQLQFFIHSAADRLDVTEYEMTMMLTPRHVACFLMIYLSWLTASEYLCDYFS